MLKIRRDWKDSLKDEMGERKYFKDGTLKKKINMNSSRHLSQKTT